MNDGVRILLERMKTNPEEFLGERDGKWEHLVYRFHEYLDPEDHETFKKELNKLMQQRFTEKVMEELVAPKLENPYIVKPVTARWGTQTPMQYTADELINAGAVTGTITSNSLTLGNTTLSEETLKQILDRREKRIEENKKPATLFGRLFNYQ